MKKTRWPAVTFRQPICSPFLGLCENRWNGMKKRKHDKNTIKPHRNRLGGSSTIWTAEVISTFGFFRLRTCPFQLPWCCNIFNCEVMCLLDLTGFSFCLCDMWLLFQKVFLDDFRWVKLSDWVPTTIWLISITSFCLNFLSPEGIEKTKAGTRKGVRIKHISSHTLGVDSHTRLMDGTPT